MTNWRVDEGENLSLHKNILFEVALNRKEPEKIRGQVIRSGWNFRLELMNIARRRLEETINRVVEENITYRDFIKMLEDVCNGVFLKRASVSKVRKGKYWWNEIVAERRRECHHCRRTPTRVRRGGQQDEIRRHEETYKNRRRELKKEIMKSKEQAWKKLVEDLNRDVWGQAYKIAMKRLGGISSPQINDDKRMKIARELFPDVETIQ